MNYFDEFVRSRQYLKNVTPKTLEWYRCSFAAFQKFHPQEAYTTPSLRAFIVALRSSGVSPISCNTYCRAINAYLRRLHEEGHASELLRILPLKTERKVLATFTAEQVTMFLHWRPQTFAQQRLYALVSLL